MLNPKEQMQIICKGVHLLVNEEELLAKLEKSYSQKKPLIIKLGLDPSAPDIHLGHTVVLRKVRQMQDLGHEAVIVIGDFTGKIGDPTGKSKGRVALSEEQVQENARTYCQQIFQVLDEKKTTVRFNSQWLSELKFETIIKLASTVTVARMLERDDFQNRYRNQSPIGLHEFFYPLMQAYDSIELKADIELGGTDQTFNILMGRTLQKELGEEQQVAIFMPILEGLDGIEKMSKSLNNYIGVKEPAEIMFKKTMEIPDQLILRYFELVTDIHPAQIQEMKKQMENGVNPKDIKLILARCVTQLYHTREDALGAEEFYHAAFTRKSIPEQIPELLINEEEDRLLDLIPKLIEVGMIKSKSEFLRVLKQGGVWLEGEKLTQEDTDIVLVGNEVLKIGKKRFIRIIK